MEFPRVLVVCTVRLNMQTGGGVAMSGFFRGWPIDSIAQIHSDDFTEYDYSVCKNYYYLPATFTSNGRFYKSVGYMEKAQNYLLKSNPFFKIFGVILYHGFTKYMPKAHLNKEASQTSSFQALLRWCRKFNPQIIYCQPINTPLFYMRLPVQLAHILDVPLVTHIMDDWPARVTRKYKALNSFDRIEWLQQNLEILFQQSAKSLSICETMSEAFQKRYGVPFTVFQHGIDRAEWKNIHKDYSKVNNKFQIVYVGKLLPFMQLNSLHDFAKIVAQMNADGISISLDIYGPDFLTGRYSKALTELPGVNYCGFISREEFPQLLADADILIIPVNFDEESVEFVRYSMPAKVPEYMASGSAILVYGPRGVPPVDYAISSEWGYVVTERNEVKLKEAILTLISSPEMRAELGQRSRQLAFQDHDYEKIRNRFRTLLNSTLM